MSRASWPAQPSSEQLGLHAREDAPCIRIRVASSCPILSRCGARLAGRQPDGSGIVLIHNGDECEQCARSVWCQCWLKRIELRCQRWGRRWVQPGSRLTDSKLVGRGLVGLSEVY